MRSCPVCDRTLKLRATSCDCGWSEKPMVGGKQSALLASALDHQCTWEANGKRCRYPVTFFEPGQTRGFYRWHKRCGHDGAQGAQIVDQSHADSNREYSARTHLETYGIRVDLDRPSEFVPSATVEEARERCMATMRKLSFSRPGNRDWAYAILAKHKGGEKVSMQALSNAMNAIRTDPNRSQPIEAFEEAA